MSSHVRKQDDQPSLPVPHADDYIAPAPRVSVQAFCESVATAVAVKAAAEDRRLGKAHLTVQMGGVATA
ncbi:MAG: CtpF protein, partial [Bradyrhizobium sp.]|nr:CtpF protein [Bradyrhizobium sp.]